MLKSRGRSQKEIKRALLALKRTIDDYGAREIHTVGTVMLASHLELMADYGLSHFDSLIALAALHDDGIIVSDDPAFDKGGRAKEDAHIHVNYSGTRFQPPSIFPENQKAVSESA